MNLDKPAGSRLFIVCGHLCQEETLRRACSKYGSIQHVKLLREKGVAYVKFPTASEAARCMENLHGEQLKDGSTTVQLKVLLADPADSRSNHSDSTYDSPMQDPDNCPPRSRLFMVVPRDCNYEPIEAEMRKYDGLEYFKSDLVASKGIIYVKYKHASSALKALEDIAAASFNIAGLRVKAMLAEPKSSSRNGHHDDDRRWGHLPPRSSSAGIGMGRARGSPCTMMPHSEHSMDVFSTTLDARPGSEPLGHDRSFHGVDASMASPQFWQWLQSKGFNPKLLHSLPQDKLMTVLSQFQMELQMDGHGQVPGGFDAGMMARQHQQQRFGCDWAGNDSMMNGGSCGNLMNMNQCLNQSLNGSLPGQDMSQTDLMHSYHSSQGCGNPFSGAGGMLLNNGHVSHRLSGTPNSVNTSGNFPAGFLMGSNANMNGPSQGGSLHGNSMNGQSFNRSVSGLMNGAMASSVQGSFGNLHNSMALQGLMNGSNGDMGMGGICSNESSLHGNTVFGSSLNPMGSVQLPDMGCMPSGMHIGNNAGMGGMSQQGPGNLVGGMSQQGMLNGPQCFGGADDGLMGQGNSFGTTVRVNSSMSGSLMQMQGLPEEGCGNGLNQRMGAGGLSGGVNPLQSMPNAMWNQQNGNFRSSWNNMHGCQGVGLHPSVQRSSSQGLRTMRSSASASPPNCVNAGTVSDGGGIPPGFVGCARGTSRQLLVKVPASMLDSKTLDTHIRSMFGQCDGLELCTQLQNPDSSSAAAWYFVQYVNVEQAENARETLSDIEFPMHSGQRMLLATVCCDGNGDHGAAAAERPPLCPITNVNGSHPALDALRKSAHGTHQRMSPSWQAPQKPALQVCNPSPDSQGMNLDQSAPQPNTPSPPAVSSQGAKAADGKAAPVRPWPPPAADVVFLHMSREMPVYALEDLMSRFGDLEYVVLHGSDARYGAAKYATADGAQQGLTEANNHNLLGCVITAVRADISPSPLPAVAV